MRQRRIINRKIDTRAAHCHEMARAARRRNLAHDVLEYVEHIFIAAEQLVDRKIARKHAAIHAERFDGVQNERPDTVHRPFPVAHSQPGNLAETGCA
jgi:hypothetical protein